MLTGRRKRIRISDVALWTVSEPVSRSSRAFTVWKGRRLVALRHCKKDRPLRVFSG